MALSKIRNDSLADTAIHGRRNLVINGAMQVAQRGTSFDETGGTYGLDRIRNPNAAAYTTDPQWTVTQGDGYPEIGLPNSYKLVSDVAGSGGSNLDISFMSYMIEAQDLARLDWGGSNPKKAVLSFYTKCSKTGTYGLFMYNPTSGNEFITSYNVTTADAWQRIELIIPGDTGAVNSNGSLEGCRIEWRSDCTGTILQSSNDTAWKSLSSARSISGNVSLFNSAGNTVEITGLQFERADEVATPFEHRSYAEELQLCRRYFWAMVAEGEATGGAGNTNQKVMGSGYYLGSSQVELPLIFPVEMRVAPTLSSSSGTNHFFIESAGGNDGFDTWSQFASKKQSALLYRSNAVVSGTAGQSGRIIAASSSAYVYWSAEL